MAKKVFVSGCFDLLHSGHVAFFEEAARYGDVYVALGSDATVHELKGRPPVNSEQERLYMIRSLASVKKVFITGGSGLMDFLDELKEIRPDIFIVNEDGNTPHKQATIEAMGIEYVILKREPHAGLPPRSTTDLRSIDQLPYRIDVAGGWLDQPFVSKLYPGPVLTISLEPTIAFNERSGMATSTRNSALDLWGARLPAGDPEKLAKILFCYDNPPGTEQVSGSQDAIGLVMPGLNRAYYEGEYWPSRIDSVGDELTLHFIEQALYLIPLGPRDAEYDPLSDRNITRTGAKALSDAAENCWTAILNHDLERFGAHFRESFEAQVMMFPHMVNDMVRNLIDKYRDTALGWKLSGAGGGGYLILIAAAPVPDSVRVVIRRALA
jgi:cytidyltransferase-like protein